MNTILLRDTPNNKKLLKKICRSMCYRENRPQNFEIRSMTFENIPCLCVETPFARVARGVYRKIIKNLSAFDLSESPTHDIIMLESHIPNRDYGLITRYVVRHPDGRIAEYFNYPGAYIAANNGTYVKASTEYPYSDIVKQQLFCVY